MGKEKKGFWVWVETIAVILIYYLTVTNFVSSLIFGNNAVKDWTCYFKRNGTSSFVFQSVLLSWLPYSHCNLKKMLLPVIL